MLAAIFSFPLGVVLALGRLSTVRPVRWLSTGYIELFRSVPLLLLIYAFLLALPRFGINLPILWKLVVPIILVNVAVLAEVFRAGILSVDRGQFEAAAALGLRDGVGDARGDPAAGDPATWSRRWSPSSSRCSRTPRSATW